jgi:hypothetical protein
MKSISVKRDWGVDVLPHNTNTECTTVEAVYNCRFFCSNGNRASANPFTNMVSWSDRSSHCWGYKLLSHISSLSTLFLLCVFDPCVTGFDRNAEECKVHRSQIVTSKNAGRITARSIEGSGMLAHFTHKNLPCQLSPELLSNTGLHESLRRRWAYSPWSFNMSTNRAT